MKKRNPPQNNRETKGRQNWGAGGPTATVTHMPGDLQQQTCDIVTSYHDIPTDLSAHSSSGCRWIWYLCNQFLSPVYWWSGVEEEESVLMLASSTKPKRKGQDWGNQEQSGLEKLPILRAMKEKMWLLPVSKHAWQVIAIKQINK
jgi:hypothetical protein